MFSIILINDSPENLDRCLESISYQTYDKYELFLLTTNEVNYSVFKDIYILNDWSEQIKVRNEVLNEISGNYVFFLSSNEIIAHDGVLENISHFLQGTDIVCSDYVIGKETIRAPEKINVSDLFFNWDLFQCCFIRKEIFEKVRYSEAFNDVKLSKQAFLIEALLLQKASYNAIDILVTRCDEKKESGKDDYRRLSEYINSKLPYLGTDYEELHAYRLARSDEKEMVLKKISDTFLFKFFWRLRNTLIEKIYYKPKRALKYRLYLKNEAKKDDKKRLEIKKKIYELPLNMLDRKNDSSDIVVSLTSHGKRVADFAPYAIYSIFTQTVKPNRIVLYINKDKWNDENIPGILKRLKKSGLEIVYCTDIRSHTKLIPALEQFPDNPIITVDDDIYYNKQIIEQLLQAYNKSDKRTIFCHQGCIPIRRGGKFAPYSEWEDTRSIKKYKPNYAFGVSAFGVSSVIYPPHIFDKEVFNTAVFLDIAPHTDDIWFWIMEYRKGINVQLIENSVQKHNESVSMIEYIVENNSSALYFQNCFYGRNDKQLLALLDHYNIK